MCQLLQVGRSSFYEWLERQPSARALENQRLATRVKKIFMEGRGNYGSRRIRRLMQSEGLTISRRRVGKLMKQQDLHCKTKRKFRITTDSNIIYPSRRIDCNVISQPLNRIKNMLVILLTFGQMRDGCI